MSAFVPWPRPAVQPQLPAHFHGLFRNPSELEARDVCPHCKRETTRHRFTVQGGVVIETHHCGLHGDVAPMRSHIVNAGPV